MVFPVDVGLIEAGEIVGGSFDSQRDLKCYLLKFDTGINISSQSVDIGLLTKADENISVNFGFKKLIYCKFQLKAGTGRSLHNPSLNSIESQIDYLENELVQYDGSDAFGVGQNLFNVIWRITIPMITGTKQYIGIIEELNIDLSDNENNPDYINGSFSFKVGTNYLFSV